MGSVEFAELKAQMARIEGLLSRLTGGAMPVPAATVLVDPVATVCDEDSHRKSIQRAVLFCRRRGLRLISASGRSRRALSLAPGGGRHEGETLRGS